MAANKQPPPKRILLGFKENIMTAVKITIRNRFTGKTAEVAAQKTDGMHIYNISKAQFDRVRSSLGHGPIESDVGRVDAYKRSGNLHAVIEPSASF